jgi:hypothetical protein
MFRAEGLPIAYQRERRYRRYELQFPVNMSFASGPEGSEREAISQNVSLGGLLLKVGDQVPLHARVSWTMQLSRRRSRRPIQILGEGEVVRIQPLEQGSGFAVAIACRKPITEMHDQLLSAS